MKDQQEIIQEEESAREKQIRKEVAHHISKGRDLPTIVAWMEIKISRLKPIYDELTKKKGKK